MTASTSKQSCLYPDPFDRHLRIRRWKVRYIEAECIPHSSSKISASTLWLCRPDDLCTAQHDQCLESQNCMQSILSRSQCTKGRHGSNDQIMSVIDPFLQVVNWPQPTPFWVSRHRERLWQDCWWILCKGGEYCILPLQGKEADVVFFSCVRAKNVGKASSIGFLADVRRMNVALTRARWDALLDTTHLSTSHTCRTSRWELQTEDQQRDWD